jgi:para-nitrobenzyl esterase
MLTSIAGCAEEKASLTIGTGAATAGDAGAARADGGAASSGGSKGMDGSTGASGGATEVTVKNGKLKGKSVGDVRAFLGIPYAKPPVGELRFMPPQPAENWKDVRQATEFGPSCVQNTSALAAMGAQDEDCLTLNVFTPAADKKLPVMVWIHGGAYVSGGSNQYDGAKLAGEKQVVVVTVNYRLGVLGFLSHPELEGDAHGGVPSGNDALRDQQLALKWVRDNIDKFGGDPKNVTAFGESAGSSSTCIHSVSPTGKGLAERFIMQSGACMGTFLMTPKAAADELGSEFADALCEGEADLVACLREKDAKELVMWGSDRGTSGAGWTPVINADDQLLPEAPSAIIAAGKHTKGALLMGTNKNEWALFVQLQMTNVSTVANFNTAVDAQFPAPLNAAVKAHYTGVTDATAPATFVKIVTDAAFRCPTRALARATAAQGNDVYLYSFEHGAAFHAYEIPFVFGNASPALGITDVEPVRPVMQTYWSQFAKTGSPNGGDQPEWPAYDADGDQHMVLKGKPEAGEGLSAADCDFWDSLTAPRP